MDGEFIGGCDIVTEMYNNGELQTLLKGIDGGDRRDNEDGDENK